MVIHSQNYGEVMVTTNYIFLDVKKLIKKIRDGRISIMYLYTDGFCQK